MATTLASLVVTIGADVTGVTAGMNTLNKRTRSLKAQFGSIKDSTLTWQGALGVLAGATGLAFAAKKVFDLGAAVEETSSKFSTVFGPSVSGAQKFLDEFANTAGLTITQGRELLATTGAIAQGMGMSQAASASFAEEIVRLSADLASFNNVPTADTSKAIISALTGERESLKRLNVVINEADVQSRALAMTGKATAGALTQQEKATATLALITERAGVAVGDLDRTMDSPANRAKKLVAEFLSLRDTLANALLPAFSVVLTELGLVTGSDGFDGLGKKITENSGRIAAWAKFAVEAFKIVALAITAPIRIAFNLGQVIGELGNIVASVMTGNFAGAGEAAKRLVGDFGDIDAAVAAVDEGFDRLRIASGDAWQAIADGTPPVTAAAAVTGQLADETLRLADVGIRTMTNQITLGLPTVTAYTGALTAQTVAAGELDEASQGMVSTLSSGFANAITQGQNFAQAMHQMAQQIIRDLIRVAIQGALMRAFLGVATGGVGFLGGLFGGGGVPGRASGGPVSAGSPYMVGERGPELFVPRSSGSIVPNGQGGGGASASAIVDLAFRRMPAPPTASSPQEMARDRYWRQFGAELVTALKHDGVRFA